MEKEITITRKVSRNGDDGYKVISVRMKEELVDRLTTLSLETNRSRNELINIILTSALDQVVIEE